MRKANAARDYLLQLYVWLIYAGLPLCKFPSLPLGNSPSGSRWCQCNVPGFHSNGSLRSLKEHRLQRDSGAYAEEISFENVK